MTGAVVPWSRPTTCTSWLPDDVSVKATTVAGSGLIGAGASRCRGAPSGAPGCRRAVPTACTDHRIAPGLGLVVAPGSGGRCRGRRRGHDAGARGIPQVGDVDAPAGGRGEPRSELVAGAGRDRSAAAGPNEAPPSVDMAANARTASPAVRPGHGHAPSGGHDARRRQHRCRRRCRRRCSRPRGPTSAHRSSWPRAGPAGTCRSPSRPARSARCGTRRSRGRRAARPARGHGSDRCRKGRWATRAWAGTTSPRRSWSRSGRSRSPAGCRCSWHPRRSSLEYAM